MASVQRLRAMAKESGNLESNEQQKVATEQTTVEGQTQPQTVITIAPANPQVVYVPTYNPTYVYGAWPYPAYPPYYIPPPVGYGIAAGVATGIAFGIGIGVTNAMWGGFAWGRNDVNINVNRYNSINTHRHLSANQTSWTRNNQARINNARANTRYNQTVNRGGARPAAGTREGQRARAQQSMQQRQPGAYSGSAQQRAQGARTQGAGAAGANRGAQDQRPSPQGRSAPSMQGRTGGGPSARPSGGAPPSRGSMGGAPRGGGMRGGGGGRRR
jgi:Protein of unknown function (DUF3300)